jgi:hypothetical protein
VIKAKDLPRGLTCAFLDTLEAWHTLEHDLFMMWQFYKRKGGLDDSWAEFSSLSTRDQRKAATAVAREQFGGPLPPVFERLKELAQVRDRIVHGRWGMVQTLSADETRAIRTTYLRIYDARGEPARPRDEIEEQEMLGKSRFYEADLLEVEKQFRQAARDVRFAFGDMMGARRRPK